MMQECLAWRMYPLPNGTRYSAKELVNPDKVIELFDYCQILEAVIYQAGWKFLISQYGYQGLFQLDQNSAWSDCTSVQEYQCWIEAQSLDTPEQTGAFI